MKQYPPVIAAESGAVKEAPFFLRFFGPLSRIGAFIFPPTCPSCNRYLTFSGDWPLCSECSLNVEVLAGPLCPRCGRSSNDGGLCRNCLEGLTPEPDFIVRSAARYTGPLSEAILAAKAGGREDVARVLGAPLAALARPFLPESGRVFVIPVPLHRHLLLERGFNLPDRLARRLAREIGGSYRPASLKRVIDTPPQKEKTFSERLVNVKGAFDLPKPSEFSEQFIFLVDDVVTSGATLAAAAEPLISAGAEVVGLTVARA